MNIDWGKAPHDATHFSPATDDFVNLWAKLENGSWFYCPMSAGTRWHRGCAPGKNEAYVPRPITWNGEGLPPVGIDCETLWDSNTGEYVAVRIVGHDEDHAVVRFTAGERKGEYDSDQQHCACDGYPIFRPIRTPEQIAADERLHQIRNACTAINKAVELYNTSIDCSAAICAAVEAMIDAGYRKQVQP